MQDARGLEISTDNPEIIQAIDHFTAQIVSVGSEPHAILQAASQYPDCFILQVYAGFFYNFSLRHDEMAKGSFYLEQATSVLENTKNTLTQRERDLYHIALCWAQTQYDKTLELIQDYSRTWPADILIAKIAEFIFFCLGQADNGQAYLNYISDISEQNQNNSHVLAMHSFALELTGQYKQAITLAEKAISINPATPWAHHTLAHAHYALGNHKQGIIILEKFASTWKDFSRVVQTHNTWHLALFYLANNQIEEAKACYQPQIWGECPDLTAEQVDAISILWRFELADIKVEQEKWQDIASYLDNHYSDFFSPFLTAHYCYALNRAGKIDKADDLINQCHQHANEQVGLAKHRWHQVGLPLILAVNHFARDNFAKAANILEPVIQNIYCVGGSDAQDELFLQLYIVSLRKSGRTDAAKLFTDKTMNR